MTGSSSALVAAIVLFMLAGTPPQAALPTQAIDDVLNSLHDSASKADGERYFSLFAPDAVFLGTDATERWPVESFRRYAMQRFATGTGWTYEVLERHVNISPSRETAWFDERLSNEKYGECRGTGVLVKTEDGWKIVQYNLTIPVPNQIALQVVEMIRNARP